MRIALLLITVATAIKIQLTVGNQVFDNEVTPEEETGAIEEGIIDLCMEQIGIEAVCQQAGEEALEFAEEEGIPMLTENAQELIDQIELACGFVETVDETGAEISQCQCNGHNVEEFLCNEELNNWLGSAVNGVTSWLS